MNNSSENLNMKNIDWFDDKLMELIKTSKNDDSLTPLNETNIWKAKELITNKFNSKDELLMILASINLLNAAIKRPEYKNQLSYAEIKGNVSRIIDHLIILNNKKYDIDFYINKTEKCAYIELFNLQFSFHNISINDTIREFIDSDRNKVKVWKEIKLQKIADELFNLSSEKNKMNNK